MRAALFLAVCFLAYAGVPKRAPACRLILSMEVGYG